MEVLEGGGEGNRGSREDKAGCNDVAFNYPPISPECLKGQPLHNQHTDTHTTHTHTIFPCAASLKHPTGNFYCSKVAVL